MKCHQASHEFVRVLDAKLIFSVLAAGIMSFCGVVVETAMNVAFPVLMQEFSVDTATVQWMTTGYLVMLAIVIPTSAYLKSNYSTKTLFVTALSLFIVGIGICAFANTFAFLLLGRIVQGLGTGIALPLMFNIVLDQTPFEHMGLMIGVATLVTALAPAVGPSLGGFIIESYGWRQVFWVLVPVLCTALIMGLTSIRQATALMKTKFDVRGFVFFAVFVVAAILGLSNASAQLAITPVTGIEIVVSIVALILFVVRSKRCEYPLLNLVVFKTPVFCCALAILFLLQLIILALGYLQPNYAQLVCGAGPAISGSVMLPGCLLGAVLAPISGRILDRFGAKKPILTGNFFVLLALSLMFGWDAALTVFTLTVFYVVFTFGSNLCVGNTMTFGLKSLPESYKPDGNALVNTAQQMAGALGTALVTGVMNAYQVQGASLEVASAQGGHVGFGLLIVFCVIMLCCSIAMFKFHSKLNNI